MYLEIVTPEASLVQGEVSSVSVPGADGAFQMLENHAAIVSTLAAGEVKFVGQPKIADAYKNKFTQKDGAWHLAINSGTVQMVDNKIIVLAD
ncbi:MAG: F0F1 ATP synthase subunit epsilon [Flavobacteriaceae bacterium]|jgi:F-type H+-transporting ATPase subunit epsilon|nr:F0F1 ATP synthase subunit epsilon [Flavobacteriaceae bacterium]MDB2388779.1 F0F1 ATP synthase subunit epsilon [Flavobacteriaceae bacterium]MDB2463841.1 F0F1 ATP synthase subunit epsilon [Flavobacteriaceae bacterium]MDB2587228.1 F0F1 ATP synthase subunit epsilon [Flavobacteriaceae bacterium]MDC0408874.1 F0F1 ATP synthase subunit epsilon [Flavobacteriaceae bacterium]